MTIFIGWSECLMDNQDKSLEIKNRKNLCNTVLGFIVYNLLEKLIFSRAFLIAI